MGTTRSLTVTHICAVVVVVVVVVVAIVVVVFISSLFLPICLFNNLKRQTQPSDLFVLNDFSDVHVYLLTFTVYLLTYLLIYLVTYRCQWCSCY